MTYHYWIGKHGYIFSSGKEKPTKGNARLKYMGFSSDLGWPKLMNTGRLLYQHQANKKKKLLHFRKTDIALKSATMGHSSVPTKRSSNGMGSPNSSIVRGAKAARLPPENEVRSLKSKKLSK